MKIYIAGKIKGDPSYKEKFQATAAQAEKCGDAVLSPAILPEGMTKADYMRICFAMIDTADTVLFLPDWKESTGARLEMEYCRYIGKNHAVLEV